MEYLGGGTYSKSEYLREGTDDYAAAGVWVLGLELKPGKTDDLKALMAEMVESTRAEPGTLAYEWWIADDNSRVHVFERYSDSDDVLAHLGVFGERFATRLLDAVDPTGFTVYGSPSVEVRAALEAFGPTYMGPYGGFVRPAAAA